MVGQTISHYRILEELGRGGMGIVYKAEDINLGRAVALKVLPPQLVSPEDRERFRREAQAAAALNHPNIATIHDFGETEGGQTFIVMELVEGEALSDRIRKGPLEASDAMGILRQMAEGLAAAHDKGIVHRDVKPSNTMLTEDNRVKILDFGLAKLTGGADLTKTGSTLGTMAYVSPEQVQGQPVDQRSDLWSLGVALYEMLTAEKPFAGAYEAAVIYGIVNQPVELEDDRIPEELRPLLGRLLNKDPDQRFESARELLATLDGSPGTASTVSGEAISRWLPRSLGREAVRPVLIAAVVLTAAVGAWKIIESNTPSTDPVLPSVAVMYVQNDTQQERLGASVRHMLSRNLSRVEQIRTVNNVRLNDLLNQERGDNRESIDALAATRIAREEGIDWVITGSVLQLGPEYVLDVDLIDTESGDVLASESSTAVSLSGVMDAVNQLTSSLLLALGDVGRDVLGPLLIQDVSTSMLSAYGLYERGLNEWEHWRFDEALEYFTGAIEVDSTFAAAYIQAATVISVFALDPSHDVSDARRFLQRAEPHLSRATSKEQGLFRALHEWLSFPDDDSEVQALYRSLADTHPDDKELQLLAGERGGGETAIKYLNQTLDLDPSYGDAYNLLAYDQMAHGRRQEAVSTIRRYRAAQPNNPNSMDSAWEIMTAAEETEEVIQVLDGILEDHPEWKRRIEWKKAYSMALAGDTNAVSIIRETYADTTFPGMSTERHVSLILGRWQRARELSDALMSKFPAPDSSARGLARLRSEAAVRHASRHHEEAEQLLREAEALSWKVYGVDFNPFPVLAAYQNGLGYADAGDRTRLVEAIQKMEEVLDAPGLDNRHRSYLHRLQADLALMDGDPVAARRHIDRVKGPGNGWSSHDARLLARIEGMEGNVEEALWHFRRAAHHIYLRTLGVSAYPSFFIDHAIVPYEIARMYEERGDRAEAIRRYEDALRTWKASGADFHYIELVRERLAELR